MTLAKLCRFVRDTKSDAHTYQNLVYRFGGADVREALSRGYIAQQVWSGQKTHYIDLTVKGEQMLCSLARKSA